MEITVKNMVCPRCIKAVNQILDEVGAEIATIDLGKAHLKNELTSSEINTVKSRLREEGFEWVDDRKQKIVNEIKSIIIQSIHQQSQPIINWSTILSEKLNYEYKYLSQLFSSIHGITIEQFIIMQKIEKVKELLHYEQLTLSEIAYQMKYSSVAHLSAQFKKITGMTPSQFKKERAERQSIDLI